MKRYYCMIFILLMSAAVPTVNTTGAGTDVLFQTSTLDALLTGIYDGDVTYHELKQHGGFGLGTFNALDGEMVALNGEFYQIKADGQAYPVSGVMKTPFAAVTFFETDIAKKLVHPVNYSQLREAIDRIIPTKNIFYAIRIHGTFDYLKARSVRKQKRPYPPFAKASKDQVVFEFHGVGGTVVGFRCPQYVSGINAAGYHLHFITDDRNAGGHILEIHADDITVEIDQTAGFYMVLPDNTPFFETDFADNR